MNVTLPTRGTLQCWLIQEYSLQPRSRHDAIPRYSGLADIMIRQCCGLLRERRPRKTCDICKQTNATSLCWRISLAVHHVALVKPITIKRGGPLSYPPGPVEARFPVSRSNHSQPPIAPRFGTVGCCGSHLTPYCCIHSKKLVY